MSLLEPAGERSVRQELGQAGRAVPVFVAIGVLVVRIVGAPRPSAPAEPGATKMGACATRSS